ncbi:MAG TPA: hypothetical protein VFB96_14455 [Pirellulaceae bacterium]|nr:hypothetical protein [Pirellulaceae bacterium]
MSDLLISGGAMAAVGLAFFLATCYAARTLPPRTLNLLALLVVASLGLYVEIAWYDVRLARWLPYSSLIVLGNWLPLFAAVLAGISWRSAAGSRVRQFVLSSSLLVTALYALVYPALGSAPACENRWDKTGICLQTTKVTCSPACAATLLAAHGIEATEQEMAELCLTRRGTSWQGLYRGLKLKTAGTPWDVEVVACSTARLRELSGSPLILSVGLDRGNSADTDYTREFGWVPGVNHSVILHKFSRSGAAVISDPSIEMSREQWEPPMLQTLWRGYALRLVRRAP